VHGNLVLDAIFPIVPLLRKGMMEAARGADEDAMGWAAVVRQRRAGRVCDGGGQRGCIGMVYRIYKRKRVSLRVRGSTGETRGGARTEEEGKPQ